MKASDERIIMEWNSVEDQFSDKSTEFILSVIESNLSFKYNIDQGDIVSALRRDEIKKGNLK